MHLPTPAALAAADPKPEAFRTWRVEVENTGRILMTGFSSPSTRFSATPGKEAAEFTSELTARRVMGALYVAMVERCAALRMDPPARLIVTESKWDDTGIDAWDALMRADRTSVEVGRFEASVLPFSLRTSAPCRNGVGR